MSNIWGFLNQTLFLSSITAIILFIKFLMRDKLPARWQYGVWNIAREKMEKVRFPANFRGFLNNCSGLPYGQHLGD